MVASPQGRVAAWTRPTSLRTRSKPSPSMAGPAFMSCCASSARPQSEPARLAAGRALARLWLLDQLVAEEEKAVVRRGYTVTWSARAALPACAARRDSDRPSPTTCLFSRTAAAASDRRTWNGRIACWARGARPSKSSRRGPRARAGSRSRFSPATSRPTARIAWCSRPGSARPA